nr:unnamed protein product [Callosobruchus analis]
MFVSHLKGTPNCCRLYSFSGTELGHQFCFIKMIHTKTVPIGTV